MASVTNDNGLFKIIKASAGSGKTYNLVKEYLKIILSRETGYRNVLAITFTNKAAKEMKSRIITALIHLSDTSLYCDTPTVKFLLNDLSQELPNTSPTAISVNAKSALFNIIHNYSDFAVSTIDSFSHRLIRSFAREMNLSMGFGIDLDFDLLIEDAVSNLIDHVGDSNNRDLTDFLIKFTEFLNNSEENISIEKPLINVGKILQNEKIFDDMQKDGFFNVSISDFNIVINNFQKQKEELIKEIHINANIACNEIIRIDLSVDDFKGKSRGVGQFFFSTKKKPESPSFSNTICDAMEEPLDISKWCTKGGKANEISSISQCLLLSFHNIKNAADKLNEVSVVSKNLYTLAMLNEIAKELSIIEFDRNILPIAEFNRKISEVIAMSDAPFIYERIGEKFANYMIDEFQDTSILQWQNLIPLFINALSSGNSCLIVGDGKQAIYRWRNGDVKQFVHLSELANMPNPKLNSTDLFFRRHINPATLPSNYRSAQEIVDFNNSLFEYLVTEYTNAQEIKDVYKNGAQTAQTTDTGYIELNFYSPDVATNTYDEYNCEHTLKIINNLHDDLCYSYNDIAILCNRKSQGKKIADFLLENDISVTSPDSLLLSYSPKVLFILSLIKMIAGKSSDIDLYCCIKLLCDNGVIDDEVNKLFRKRQEKSRHIRQFEEICQKYNLDFNVKTHSTLPGFEFCEHAIQCFKLDGSDAYMQQLLNTFQEHRDLSLTDIPKWFEDRKDTLAIAPSEEIDAVRITTIHKSKGLEFPVVIAPFVDYDTNKKGGSGDMIYVKNPNQSQEDLRAYLVTISQDMLGTSYEHFYNEEIDSRKLDMLNLLYVTFTRPKDKLYIISQKPKVNKNGTFSSTDIPSLLYKYCNDTEKTSFYFGENVSKTNASAEKKDSKTYDYIYNNWRDRISIAISPERITKSDYHNTGVYVSEEILWGKKIHSAMSMLRSENDMKNVADKLKKIYVISKEEEVMIMTLLRSMLADRELYDLLFTDNDRVYMEREMYDKESDKIYRADRINVKGDTCCVIDFKTGEERKEHLQQVNDYCNLLRKATAGKDIKGYLIYVNGNVPLIKSLYI